MTGSFEFFSHFIIKDKITFFDEDIEYFPQLIFSDDELCLKFLFILIFLDDRLFLCLVFFVIEGNPVKSELLVVYDDIALDDLLFKFLHFFFIHGLNFVVPFKIRFFKMFELSLEFFELPIDSFIISR